jgi:excisionase family DNA binding protein
VSSRIQTRQVVEDVVEAALAKFGETQAETFARLAREIIVSVGKPEAHPSLPRGPPLSISEAMEELGGSISRRTIYRLAERGDLEFIRVGGLVRVTRGSVDRLLAQGYRPRHFPQLKHRKVAEPA